MRLLAAVVSALVLAPVAASSPDAPASVCSWTIHYRAHDGVLRRAFVLLPAWYGPDRDPPIPLIVSPHGRGIDALANTRIWGDLPARGGFAVVNPEGQGRRLRLFSWGDPGQIDDLGSLPADIERSLPWLRIDRRRVYAVGGSMGGQEALLLAARRPRMLAGVAAFDAPADLALRYRDFEGLRRGAWLRRLAREEVGGTPASDSAAYAARSPLDHAAALAFSGVPLELWWSTRDRVVADGRAQAGALFRRILALNPRAPVVQVVGRWGHCRELRWNRALPTALRLLGLLPPQPVSASSAASTSDSDV